MVTKLSRDASYFNKGKERKWKEVRKDEWKKRNRNKKYVLDYYVKGYEELEIVKFKDRKRFYVFYNSSPLGGGYLTKKQFKTKSQAIKFAKEYMKKH